jgi:hypothetical protein
MYHSLASTFNSLDKLHANICRLETALADTYETDADSGDSDEDDDDSLREVDGTILILTDLLASRINLAIKEIIRKTEEGIEGYPLGDDECIKRVQDFIVSAMNSNRVDNRRKEQFVMKLQVNLVKIIRLENWARQGSNTYKYAELIWQAMRRLGFWMYIPNFRHI